MSIPAFASKLMHPPWPYLAAIQKELVPCRLETTSMKRVGFCRASYMIFSLTVSIAYFPVIEINIRGNMCSSLVKEKLRSALEDPPKSLNRATF